MGNLNFQDVIRDVHDASLHSLKTTASLSASTVYVGNSTLYAVVNTGSASDSTVKLGFVTAAISTPTLFAVVNTAAAGQASIVLDNSVASIGFATVAISTPTIFAVVNTGGANTGNSTINPGPNQIGSVTVSNPITLNSVVTLSSSTNYIGLASVNIGGTLPALVASTVNIGSVSVLGGGIGLNSGINSIGFATVALSTPTIFAVVNTGAAGVGNSIVTINPRIDYFGLVSVSGNVVVSSLPATPTGANYIGLASVNIGGTLPALTASTVNIGSVSILGGGIALTASTVNVGSVSVLGGTIAVSSLPALVASTVNIGSVSVLGGTINAVQQTSTFNIGSVSILGGSIVNSAGTSFIGLVTAVTRNAGTNKALINLPVGFSAGSTATIAIPTNANTMYITSLLLNSDATVRVTLKSGVTYLTGNASIGVTLNPGGGLVMTGSPDSPSWIGLPSGALVVEKLDLTATIAKIAGNVVYFQE